MDNIEQALADYARTLDLLPEQGDTDGDERVLGVLLARDMLARRLADPLPLSPALVAGTTQQDQRLKDQAAAINAIVGRKRLAAWRASLNPPSANWWWSLDELQAQAAAQSNPIWGILAGFCIAAALSLLAEIARRFLAGGPDFIGTFSTLSQAFLALLAGGTFLAFGRSQVEQILSRAGIQRQFQPYWRTALALAVLLVILGMRLSLPSVATYYNNQGHQQRQRGRLTSAIESYERAVSLNPDYTQAYYNLGNAYEDVLEYDKAMSQYQRAIYLDANFSEPYNNLARLYLLQKGDAEAALPLLNQALALPDLPQFVRYSLLKNRGWANLIAKHYASAESDLTEALDVNSDGTAPHCLLAQLYEGQEKQNQALGEWEACLRNKGQDAEVTWLGVAKERLDRGAAK